MQFIKVVIASLCLCSALTFQANADILEAYEAFHNKDYDEAAKHFKRSADLGHAKAQSVLAKLHMHGAGVKKDMVLAYVYLALSDEQLKTKESKQQMANIFVRLSDSQKKLAKDQLIKFKKAFGKAQLTKSIMPMLVRKPFVLRPTKRIERPETVTGSAYTIKRMGQSSTILEYDIAPDGSVRDVAIAHNFFSSQGLIDNMVNSTYQAKFAVRDNQKYKTNNIEDQRIVWVNRKVSKAYLKTDVPKLYKRVNQLEALADQGNANAQYELGMYITVFPALYTNKRDAIPYFKDAAASGHPKASLEYSYHLFKGFKGVKPNIKQGLQYLLSAAKSSDARAQYRLAREFLSGRIVKKDHSKAIFWLNEAINSGDENAKFWLARTLLEQDEVSPVLLNQVQKLLDNVKRAHERNPNWYYYFSKVHIKKGEPKNAIATLEEAIELADDLDWKVPNWQTQLKQLHTNKI